MKSIGHFSLERSLVKKLTEEAPSVQVLFYSLVSHSFTYRIAVRKPDNSVEVWGEGSRPWSQRTIAETTKLSINTVRRGLNRLKKLGLIKLAISKLGTVVQIINFYRYRKQGTGVWHTPPFSTGREELTRGSDSRCATSDHYRKSIKEDHKKLTNSISATARNWMENLGVGTISPGLAALLG